MLTVRVSGASGTEKPVVRRSPRGALGDVFVFGKGGEVVGGYFETPSAAFVMKSATKEGWDTMDMWLDLMVPVLAPM